MERLVLGLLVFNILQLIAWSILLLPSMTAWRKSVEWIVFMSWYANEASALAALGTSIIMMEQRRRDKEDG